MVINFKLLSWQQLYSVWTTFLLILNDCKKSQKVIGKKRLLNSAKLIHTKHRQ